MADRLDVSIVMPAFRAEHTIVSAVRSVLAQSVDTWELIIVSDDGVDYQALLGDAGIADPRLRFFESGRIGGGSPPARNVGLDAVRYDLVAILDADDRFKPQKLEAMAPLALEHGLASCALEITLPDGTHLRHVGRGADVALTPARYKFTNLSMDSMLVYDRRRADPRFDPSLPCLTDIDFLLKIFATVPQCMHLGEPLHDYVKMPVSVSNGPGVREKMMATKSLLRGRLAQGFYGLDSQAVEGVDRFLAISLGAEASFAPRQGLAVPDLFEDHLEALLP